MTIDTAPAPLSQIEASTSDLLLVVRSIETVARGVVEVQLQPPPTEALPAWAPGSHVVLKLAPGIERQYSLCGDPDTSDIWRIAVLREPDGRGGSAFIHDNLSVGDRVTTSVPTNQFPLESAPSYLFIAGGIGITPIIPMLRAAQAAGAPWRLVYGGRDLQSMAYRDELASYGDRVVFWPEDQRGLIDVAGELSAAGNAHVYTCGPGPLLDAVSDQTTARDIPVHLERFRATESSAASTPFEIYLDYSDMTLEVGPDESILDVVQGAGIDVASSCGQGTCETCITDVLDGVPDHRDAVLSPEERAENDSIAICCSRALTPRLVLDL